MKSNQAKRVKLLAAPIGGSAVVTMGALSIALSEGQDGPVNYGAGFHHDSRRNKHPDDAGDDTCDVVRETGHHTPFKIKSALAS